MATSTHSSDVSDSVIGLSIGGSAREAFEAALDAVNRSTVEPCNPAGDWYREQDGTFLKIWRRACTGTDTDVEEQVAIQSDGLVTGWHVYHDRTDGTTERVTDDLLDRDAAFRKAEQTMERLSGVRPERA